MKKILSTIGLLVSVYSVHAQYTPPSQITNLLNKYRDYSELTKASSNTETFAVNITTWQMTHGGFSKAMTSNYASPWDGKKSLSGWTSNGTPLGMFDNNATVMEAQFLANQYKVTTNATNKAKFKTAVNKVVDFVLVSQHASGSWPQVYPKRTGTEYSNLATYNDNAMVRVMTMVKDMTEKRAPFDSDIIDAAKLTSLKTALSKSVQFALNAQIKNNGVRTVWCQQHDPVTFAPAWGRAYELPSKSGSESIGILNFLMNWPEQTATVQEAVRAGFAWYKKTKVANMKFTNGTFVTSSGSSMWYRFYNVENDNHFFANRDSSKVFNFSEVEAERQTGYQWAGDYGSALLNVESYYNPPTAISSSSTVVSSSSVVKPSSSSAVVSSSSVVKPSSSSAAVSSSSVVVSSSSVVVSSSSVVVVPYTANLLLEGENFCSANGVQESKNVGYQGAAYLNLDNALGSKAMWTITATKLDSFTLDLRYANGGTTTRPMQLIVNGKSQVASWDLPATGSWTQWLVSSKRIQLAQGYNTVELVALTADGGPNLDLLGIKSTGLTDAQCKEPVPTTINKITLFTQSLNNYKVYSMQGKLLASFNAYGHLNSMQLKSRKELLKFNRGLYTVQIQNDKQKTTSFILQK